MSTPVVVVGHFDVHGVVTTALAGSPLPEKWGPKSLEKLAFATGKWYAVGYSAEPNAKKYVVRAILRWDMLAKYPSLPLLGMVARQLFPTRSIIGHPAAPPIAAWTEEEAKEMARRLAERLASQLPSAFNKATMATLVNVEHVGEMFAEILLGIKQVLENQQKMYSEYLELKKKQVELLEQTTSARDRAD